MADTLAGDWTGDFAVPTRTDAPTDGFVLFEANYEAEAQIVQGPGAPLDLGAEYLITTLSGNETLVQVRPADGWEAGADYLLEIPSTDPEAPEPTGTLSFTVGTEPSPPPSAPLVLGSTAEEWSEEEVEHAWGCCGRTRQVSFEVESTSDDPWSYVELKGVFEGESQLSETAVLQRLDVGIGSGIHMLTWLQWEEDGQPQPAAFEVVHVSASGERSEAEVFTFEDGCGCGSPAPVSFGPAFLGFWLVRRRRARR